MTGTYDAQAKPPRQRKPKTIIPASLRDVYAGFVSKVVELCGRAFTYVEVCEGPNRQ